MIRILTFTTLYPNAAQPNHGIFVENRLRHLLRTGQVATRVVAPVPWFPSRAAIFGHYATLARAPHREVRHGLAVEHPRYLILPRVGMPITPAMLYLGSLPTVRRLGSERDFDLIDAHYFYPDGVAAVMLGAAINRPVVITARGTDVNLIPRHAIPRRLILYAAKRAGIITVSDALRRALVDLGVCPGRITVLRNGVDLTTFTPVARSAAREALGLNGKTVLSVGHLIERKGHHLIIEALTQLADCKLIIVGSGPERSSLEGLARRLSVSDRVQFIGEVPHSEMQRYYVAADVLVLASSREGWPNVLLEAMACGTPVVATAIWGNPEVVSSPEAGILARSQTAQGIVNAIKTLFRCLPDRGATRAYAERFSWEATSLGQLQLFSDIISRPHAR